MKNLFLFAALLLSTVISAQSNKEDVDLIQSLYGMGKKDIVAQFIKVDPASKDEFWRLYDEYEVTRKEYGRERLALLEKYAQHYNTLNDETTDEIMQEMINLGAKTDKIAAQYYGKIKKVAGTKVAAQFLQIESYLNSVIRSTILEEIPFIGELDE